MTSKGPLTNIRMAQFMLRDILHDNQEASSILDNMDLTLNGMIDMIRVFLDAMDSQQLEPTLEDVDVHDLVVRSGRAVSPQRRTQRRSP